MEEGTDYVVAITPEAEGFFLDIVDYLFSTHSQFQAEMKSSNLLDMALSLKTLPYRGSIESKLAFLSLDYRYLVFPITTRKTVKIIYFVDEEAKTVYVTDFFPTQMDDEKISKRT